MVGHDGKKMPGIIIFIKFEWNVASTSQVRKKSAIKEILVEIPINQNRRLLLPRNCKFMDPKKEG